MIAVNDGTVVLLGEDTRTRLLLRHESEGVRVRIWLLMHRVKHVVVHLRDLFSLVCLRAVRDVRIEPVVSCREVPWLHLIISGGTILRSQ